MRWIAFLMAACLLWTPARALACTCAVPDLRLPAQGAVGVPLNTAVWVGKTVLAESPTLTVVGMEEPVPMTCADLGPVRRCRPNAELQPLTRYRIDEIVSEFTTGTSRDETAPGAPGETARRYHSSTGVRMSQSTCDPIGPAGAVELTIDSVELGTMLVVDTSREAGPGAPTAPVTEILERHPGRGTMDAWIGTWACRSNLAAEPGDRFPLRIGAFDVAGNFSGWVQLKDAAIPYAPPGCSSFTADGTLGALLLLTALATTARRRRHA